MVIYGTEYQTCSLFRYSLVYNLNVESEMVIGKFLFLCIFIHNDERYSTISISVLPLKKMGRKKKKARHGEDKIYRTASTAPIKYSNASLRFLVARLVMAIRLGHRRHPTRPNCSSSC